MEKKTQTYSEENRRIVKFHINSVFIKNIFEKYCKSYYILAHKTSEMRGEGEKQFETFRIKTFKRFLIIMQSLKYFQL